MQIYLILKNHKTIIPHPENEKDSEVNSLESKDYKMKESDDFLSIPGIESHIIKDNRNEILNNKIFQNFPIISNVSKQNKYEENKNIFKYPEIFNKVNNNTESCEPSSINYLNLKEQMISNNLNTKNNYINKIEKKKPNLNFNIPDNFLIHFNIKEIKIENIQINSNQDICKCFIYLRNAVKFINNICQKKISNNENFNNLNLNYINKEYLELRKISSENNNNLLQRKRKLDSEDLGSTSSDDISNENQKKSRKKNYSLKKNFKIKKMSEKLKKLKKHNNKKDGKKISLYLNQIQINENSLDNFPFYWILNTKENIKIEFLKGFIDSKKYIKINKKAELIKDDRNLKYIKNKFFKIIYQNKENDMQYILHINSFHILYLILYYYNQIQENIKLMNKYYYSHASNDKINRIKNHLEILIKKCNKIVKEISK